MFCDCVPCLCQYAKPSVTQGVYAFIFAGGASCVMRLPCACRSPLWSGNGGCCRTAQLVESCNCQNSVSLMPPWVSGHRSAAIAQCNSKALGTLPNNADNHLRQPTFELSVCQIMWASLTCSCSEPLMLPLNSSD